MKRLSLVVLVALAIGLNQAKAQTNVEEESIKKTINLLFEGMRNADTSMISKAFAAKSTLETIARTKDGKFKVVTENTADFIKSMVGPHKVKLDERIEFTKILVDANLASVWTNYKFYLGDKFSHCGVNSFQLFKSETGWKIIYLIDTRRKDACN